MPTFAINYGAIGFLATIEGDRLDEGVRRALAGDFEVRPADLQCRHECRRAACRERASLPPDAQRPRGRARLLVEGQEMGEVRCDGLVISTPAGSTGYNLANGGPVMAWGRGGLRFVHRPATLTARSLVVAPEDVIEVVNLSKYEEVDMTTDGRHVLRGPRRQGQRPLRGGRVAARSAPGRNVLQTPSRKVRSSVLLARQTRRRAARAAHREPPAHREGRAAARSGSTPSPARPAPARPCSRTQLDLLLGGKPGWPGSCA